MSVTWLSHDQLTIIFAILGAASSALRSSPTLCSNRYIGSDANFSASVFPLYSHRLSLCVLPFLILT